jgi:hypothetical protein
MWSSGSASGGNANPPLYVAEEGKVPEERHFFVAASVAMRAGLSMPVAGIASSLKSQRRNS